MPTAVQVTAGSLCLIEKGVRSFNLSAGPLALSLHLADNGSLNIPAKKFPGETYSCGGQLAGDLTLHNGPVDFNGQRHALLWFTGSLEFVSKAFAVPGDGSTPVTKTVEFKMSGSLQGFPNNPFIGDPGPAVFDVMLTGKGSATVRFAATSGWPGMPDGRWVRSLFHQFHA
jgi:hypothetical protein